MSRRSSSKGRRSVSAQRKVTPRKTVTQPRKSVAPSNNGLKVGDTTSFRCMTCKAQKKGTIERFVHKTVTGKRKINFAKGKCNTCGGKVCLILANTKK